MSQGSTNKSSNNVPNLLGPILSEARTAKGLTQEAVAAEARFDKSLISQYETGKKIPTVSNLLVLSQMLDIDPEKVVFARAWAEIHGERVLGKDGIFGDVRDKLLVRLEQRVSGLEESESNSARAIPGCLTLCDWPNGFDVKNVLVGDRREVPPNTYADVLALTASTGDLTYFGELGLTGARIRSDKIVKLADDGALREKLHGDILVVGSPAANLAARVVNNSACHRFHVDKDIRERQVAIERELENIAYDGEALEAYVRPSTDEDKKRIQALKHLLYAFAKPGYVCPTSYPNEKRGFARSGRIDFGVVTLCKNPWSESGVAILAAGIGGPGTAAALKHLAKTDVFRKHPLGGVFSVKIPTEAPWEDRYDMLNPKWDSNPYDVKKFVDDVTKLGRDPDHDCIDNEEGADLLDLLSRLKNRV